MDIWGPSTFTPFFRRFGDERVRDLEDIKALYARVAHQHYASAYADDAAPEAIISDLAPKYLRHVSDDLWAHMAAFLRELLASEIQIFRMPAERFEHLSLAQTADLRQFLRAKEHFFATEPETKDLLFKGLELFLKVLVVRLPETFAPSPFTIPLIYAISDPHEFLDAALSEYSSDGYLFPLARKLTIRRL